MSEKSALLNNYLLLKTQKNSRNGIFMFHFVRRRQAASEIFDPNISRFGQFWPFQC